MEKINELPLAQPEQKSYFFRVTPVSKALAAVLFIALPFLGFWLGLTYASQSSAPIQSDAVQENSETTSVADTEGVATTTVTGYIVSINKDTVVVDYIDMLGGDEALAAKIADGYCKEGDTWNECFPSFPFYHRNVNPKLRTLKMSQDVSITSARGMALTVDQVPLASENTSSEYYVEKFPGTYYGSPFFISLNSRNEVVKIEEIFQP